MKQPVMKKDKKTVLQKTGKPLKIKLSSGNLTKRDKNIGSLFERYSQPFLKCTWEEFGQMELRARKVMTMHKAVHPRGNIERLYMSKKETRNRFSSIEDFVNASIRRLDDYTKKSKERLITVISNSTDNIMDSQTND